MGLLGIVTSITYELDQMSYARYHPKISSESLTSILPPPGTDIPDELVDRLQHYYSEFIQYLGYNGDPGVLWLYTFENDGRAEDATVIIDELENAFQEDLLFLNQVGETLFQTILEHYNAEEYLYWIFGWITGKAAAFAMPDFDTSITTTVTEAMHFRRGLHYLIGKIYVIIYLDIYYINNLYSKGGRVDSAHSSPRQWRIRLQDCTGGCLRHEESP